MYTVYRGLSRSSSRHREGGTRESASSDVGVLGSIRWYARRDCLGQLLGHRECIIKRKPTAKPTS
jgi:hypothetical protein